MYNRYIPQPDGSYRRNRIGEPPPQRSAPPPPKEEPPSPPILPNCPAEPFGRRPVPPRPVISRPKKTAENLSIGSFLKHLLPQNFDTEDLLIVLLLLLMSGDCKEDQNTALLTLVLYLFM